MNISQCSVRLRELTEAQLHSRITQQEYRMHRKSILDMLDQNFNGIAPDQQEPPVQEETVNTETLDKTQPYIANKIGQCISYLKGDK